MRRFRPVLVAAAIGGTTLFATPALAETTTVQHEGVTLNNGDDWRPGHVVTWALGQWETWNRDPEPGDYEVEEIPDYDLEGASEAVPGTSPGIRRDQGPNVAPNPAPDIAPGPNQDTIPDVAPNPNQNPDLIPNIAPAPNRNPGTMPDVAPAPHRDPNTIPPSTWDV